MNIFVIFACSGNEMITENEDSGSAAEEEYTVIEEDTGNLDIPVRTLTCRLQEMTVQQDSGENQYTYQTPYTWVGNQMTFDGGMYVYNNYGYIVAMTSEQQDWQQNISNVYDCDIWCRLLSVTTQTTSSQTTTSYETFYNWDGNIQYVESDNYYAYNNYGYIEETYLEQNGIATQVLYSYDCDDWCRILSITTRTISDETEDEIVESYDWNGNTVSHSSGYEIYNEYGYVTESFLEAMATITLTQYSYDCTP